MNCLEHARQTFRASRKSRARFSWEKSQPWARPLDVQGSQKPWAWGWAFDMPCRRQAALQHCHRPTSRTPCSWRTVGPPLFYPNKKVRLSSEDQMSTLKIFWKRWNAYTRSRTRFSNRLAYNRSKVSVKKSQIGFAHINFSRLIFPYMSNMCESGQMRRFALW